MWAPFLLMASTASYAADPAILESIQVYPTPTGSRIMLQTSRPIAVMTYMLEAPDRLIVDPVESDLVTTVSSTRSLPSAGLVTAWQVEQRQGAVDYLVFPIALPVQPTIYQAGNLITIEVEPKLEALVNPPAPPTPPEGPLKVTQAIEQALAVHEPARIALEEAELAMLKVKEARRNLFPGATVRGNYTQGKASGAQFREAQAGLQVEQPLYDAGRLRDAYKQAVVNLQISQKRYEKVRADFAFEVAQAYDELAAARQGVSLRDRLVQETRQILDVTERRFAAGLVTAMEVLNVRSQSSQAQFQLQGARNDVAMAELKFRHRMNWATPRAAPALEPFPTTTARVELEEALRMAALNRPDLQINTLLVEFHRYEELLAKKKEAWKVDLTGFLGESAGAFQTEPLNFDVDYSIALKLSKPWGGNTGSLTGTNVHTSPRVGQTTRTSSTGVQGELGILNALSGGTEIKQADVGWLKARQDLADTRHLMEQEVSEAYYAYQKALLTLEHAAAKAQFRLEQVKILRAQAELNEILPSQLVEAMLQLNDDEASQSQAQANEQVALARLNKAIGVTAYY